MSKPRVLRGRDLINCVASDSQLPTYLVRDTLLALANVTKTALDDGYRVRLPHIGLLYPTSDQLFKELREIESKLPRYDEPLFRPASKLTGGHHG